MHIHKWKFNMFLVSIIGIILFALFCGVQEPDWDAMKVPKIVDSKILEGGTKAWKQNFFLYVRINNPFPPLTFVWYKNDTIFSTGKDTVSLSPLSGSALGRYYLIVSNGFGADTSLVDTLKKDSSWCKPFILFNKKIQIIGKKALDSNLTFYISARGENPAELNFQWYKNDTAISGKTDSSISFKPLAISDNGIYTCRVWNLWGIEISLPDTILFTQTNKQPKLSNNGNLQPSAPKPEIGKQFSLKAGLLQGTQPLTFKWYKQQKGVITVLNSITDSVFAVNNLAYSDTGGYWAVVSNNFGKDSSKTYLLSFENNAPVWKSDTLHATVPEGTLLSILLSDSCKDPENDSITFTIGTGLPQSDTIINSRYLYTPSYTDSGRYEVKLIASDGKVSSSAVLKLHVENVNRKPVFLDSFPKNPYKINEGEQLQIKFKATDPDGDTVRYGYRNTTLPHFVLSNFTDSQIVWQSTIQDSGYFTMDVFAYDYKETTSVTVRVAVGHVNIPPEIQISGYIKGQTIERKEMRSLQFKVTAADANPGDVITMRGVKNAPYSQTAMGTGSYDTTTGDFIYTPSFTVADKNTQFKLFSNVTFYATDKSGALDSFVIHIKVLDSNRVPIAVDDSYETLEDKSTAMSVLANDTDPDGDQVKIAGVSQGKMGTAVVSGNNVVYTPDADLNGKDTISYTIKDTGNAMSAPAKVVITIKPANDAPSFTPGNDVTRDQDAGAVTISGWATQIKSGPANESGQVLHFEFTPNDPTGIFSVKPALNATNGNLTFTVAGNKSGIDTCKVVLKDDGGTSDGGIDSSAVKTFTITITSVNHKPVFTQPTPPTNVTMNEATTQSVDFTVADQDSTTPTVEVLSIPSWVTFVKIARMSYRLTLNPGYDLASNTQTQFKLNLTVRATDEKDTNVYTDYSVAITVNNVNRSPDFSTALPGDTTLPISENYEIPLAATDPDGDAVTITLSQQPGGMTFAGNKISWFSDRSTFVSGTSYQIKATASDDFGGTKEITWKMTLKPHVWKYLGQVDIALLTDIAGPTEDTVYRAGMFQDYMVIYKSTDKGKTWFDNPIYSEQGVRPEWLKYEAGALEIFHSFISDRGRGYRVLDPKTIPTTSIFYTTFISSGAIFLNPFNQKVYAFKNGTGPYNGDVDIKDPDSVSSVYLTQVGQAACVVGARNALNIFVTIGGNIYRKVGAVTPEWRFACSGASLIRIGSDKGDTLFLMGANNLFYCTNALSAGMSIGNPILTNVSTLEAINTKEAWIVKGDSTVYFTNNAFSPASIWQEQFTDDQGNSVSSTNIRITQDRKGIFVIGVDGKLFRY